MGPRAAAALTTLVLAGCAAPASGPTPEARRALAADAAPPALMLVPLVWQAFLHRRGRQADASSSR